MRSKAFTLIRGKGLALRAGKGFTLIELLVSIAIIGLLIGLLIPNIDRSLDKNNLANDVDLFKSKLEEVRLLAGSTQQVDENCADNAPENDCKDLDTDETGYYAVVIPRDSNTYFGVVRIAYPLGPMLGSSDFICTPDVANEQLIAGSGECLVEKINLSKQVNITGAGVEQYFGFRVPTQKMFRISPVGSNWSEVSPIFRTSNPVFELTYPGLVAKVSLDDYTARVTVEYDQNTP